MFDLMFVYEFHVCFAPVLDALFRGRSPWTTG